MTELLDAYDDEQTEPHATLPCPSPIPLRTDLDEEDEAAAFLHAELDLLAQAAGVPLAVQARQMGELCQLLRAWATNDVTLWRQSMGRHPPSVLPIFQQVADQLGVRLPSTLERIV